MKVVSMVVAVLLSSTVECSEKMDSEDLCEQIRSNQLEILTMGTRGRSQDDAHFYILVKGGYMIKVQLQLANRRVVAANRTTSITIDRDYIRVNKVKDLYSEPFDVNLSSFMVYHFKQTTAPDWTYSIVALCIGTVIGLIGIAIYLFCALRREKVKRRDKKKKYKRQNMSNLSSSSLVSSNLNSSNELNSSMNSCGTSSSNAFTQTSNPTTSSSSTASKASSVLQSVKSSITSLIGGNKSKQAKTVAKAKNSKAKENKPKSLV